MSHRIGKRTIRLDNQVGIRSAAAVAGKKEGEGPLSKFFDKVYKDDLLGEETWERAESRLQHNAAECALAGAGMTADEIDAVFAGDLLNQCISSTFGLESFSIPFLGQYGACSTMAQAMLTAALLVDSGGLKNALAVTSSHFCSAERQFRLPIEYGGQRNLTAQWTVTGAGAAILSAEPSKIVVSDITVGKIVDMDIKDADNMGAAMAPAAADTISAYLSDSGTSAEDYDLILTGDLGFVGSELLCELMKQNKQDIAKQHNDCGKLIFSRTAQDVHAGGSGCGCCASVFCGYIMERLEYGELKNILFAPTGALLSPTSSQQGESIPGICHLLHIKRND